MLRPGLLLLPLLLFGTDRPKLAIVSRLGTGPVFRVFNDEQARFYARLAGRERQVLARGVTFTLYEQGGSPDRNEDVVLTVADKPHWGSPPSVFGFPLAGRNLVPGRYRLRAEKPGHEPADVAVIFALFGYHDLETEHTKDRYRARFRIRLVDVTEKRAGVPVAVRVETKMGRLLDERKVRLAGATRRAFTWDSPGRVRLDSAAKGGKGALRIVPGASLVLVLDKVRFRYPIPLPPERKKGWTVDQPPESSRRK